MPDPFKFELVSPERLLVSGETSSKPILPAIRTDLRDHAASAAILRAFSTASSILPTM